MVCRERNRINRLNLKLGDQVLILEGLPVFMRGSLIGFTGTILYLSKYANPETALVEISENFAYWINSRELERLP